MTLVRNTAVAPLITAHRATDATSCAPQARNDHATTNNPRPLDPPASSAMYQPRGRGQSHDAHDTRAASKAYAHPHRVGAVRMGASRDERGRAVARMHRAGREPIHHFRGRNLVEGSIINDHNSSSLRVPTISAPTEVITPALTKPRMEVPERLIPHSCLRTLLRLRSLSAVPSEVEETGTQKTDETNGSAAATARTWINSYHAMTPS